MTKIETVENLEEIYGTPGAASLRKVADHITPEYRAWIRSSPFCALATVGPEGVDASPRGDEGEVVFELDEFTLAMPDRRGNNRMDSLRNIVRDGRVALMFLTPGSDTVTRINGRAYVSVDPDLIDRFNKEGHAPRSVIVIKVEEIYFQCARAVMRAGLWDIENHPDLSGLPTPGQILAAQTKGEVGGADYDAAWPERARKSMW
ncbi:MAG: pyridoxamine 5'-phosphate oxidase family protein [Pseudomonadota bacterium]